MAVSNWYIFLAFFMISLFLSSAKAQQAWVRYKYYPAGSLVQYQGRLYYAKHANPGYIPTVSTYFWAPHSGPQTLGSCTYKIWNQGTYYPAGSIVKFTDGKFYRAKFANPGYIPTVSTYFWGPHFCSSGTAPAPTPPAATPAPQPAPISAPRSNPLVGSTFFTNPWTGSNFNRGACSQMPRIADSINSIWASGDPGDLQDMRTLLGQAESKGQVATYILYNIPNRDCGSHSAGGTSADQYIGWISSIAEVIGQRKVLIVLEPDAIAGSTDRNCMSQAAADQRLSWIRQAVATLRSKSPNAIVYIDAGNPGWVPAATMANLLRQAGVDQATGFALNVSNYISTAINVTYGTQISNLIGQKHFIIDTGRNGAGAGNTWCNPAGRAVGAPPQIFSSGLVDAYIWAKEPGGSDGACGWGAGSRGYSPQMACEMAARAGW